MITIRTYPDSIAAGIAKSILDDKDIECHLFDENTHPYGKGAVPIRLLVDESQHEEALRILDGAHIELSDDSEITPSETKL